MPDKTFNSHESANDNIVNELYLDWVRSINKGNFKPYLRLGKSYENGYGVKKDLQKALKAYEKYYDAYRNLVPSQFNVVEFLIDIGNKYKSLGINYKAAEWYLQAALHIIEEYDNEEHQQEKFKKYQLEKLIKETGCHDIV